MAAGGIGKQCRRYGKREEGRRRGCSHRGYIAESARQAAVTNRFRRLPLAAEVDAFQIEVSGDDNLMATRDAQYGAVVANAGYDGAPFRGLTADVGD